MAAVLRSLAEERETSVLGGGRERILNNALMTPGDSPRGRALWSAGDIGRATILTGRDNGEDGRQSRCCRGEARGEARRARLHQQTLRTQIHPAPISRPPQHHIDPFLGWCTNYHGAQKERDTGWHGKSHQRCSNGSTSCQAGSRRNNCYYYYFYNHHYYRLKNSLPETFIPTFTSFFYFPDSGYSKTIL